MYPEFFNIGPIPIRGYGVMLALAFFSGVLYLRYISKRDDRPFEPLLTLAYIAIFGGVIGGRLAYVLMHLEEFSKDWTATFNPFASGQFGIAGLNLYGGVLLAMAGILVYTRVQKMKVLDTFDYLAPTLGLGIAFGRMGCFLNGCCFGTPCDLPWAVQFPAGSLPYSVFLDAHLHPAQLYSAFYGFGLFILTHFMLKNRKFVGQVVAVLLMIEAGFRIGIEYVRYYETEMYFSIGSTKITYNLAIGVGLFLLGLSLYIYGLRKQSPQSSTT